jgi:hypothetical protein
MPWKAPGTFCPFVSTCVTSFGCSLILAARILFPIVTAALFVVACSARHQSSSNAQVNLSQTLWNTTPAQAFDYYSGYLGGGNVPAMYAHAGLTTEQAITVVGPGFHQEFPMGNFSEAVAAYKGLLEKQGYRPLYGHPRLPPSTHPLIGSWKVSAADGTCVESDTYGSDGRGNSKSGDEELVSEFDISVAPSEKGYYRLSDTIIQSNGKPDCTGRSTAVGDAALAFIQFSEDRKSYSMCWSEDKSSCFAEGHRLNATKQ